jgi:7,8-dihydroneopterin aldolase/epimerase/oxygenase
MDETAIAFEPPHVRAAASGAGALDRISVRDHVRRVEIGAFASERGVEQRLRFNVVLEVCHHAAAEADDVDQVISYDGIIRAIEGELARERINLLETLAERVARRCLLDPRAVRVFVRVEKLDRIPGALGVEIVRSRAEGTEPLRRRSEPGAAAAAPAPVVVLAPAAIIAEAAWRDALAGLAWPCLVVPGSPEPQPAAHGEAALRAGLLALDRAAWLVAAADPRFTVAAARAEVDWALGQGAPVLWAPTKMVADAAERPAGLDASRPGALALWLAGETGAARVIGLGDDLREQAVSDGIPVTIFDPGAPDRLAAAARGS